ncbi:MAG TPA: polyprenyl synthetase family protein [Kofleriaceae bacterium]|nr:polyprenyl synthetase family protein [Kofleriaceae bacterium]
MKDREPALCAILHRLTATTLSGGEALPDAIWERALLGPAREILGRPGKGFRGRMVEIAWALAGGGQGGVCAELPLVIELIHAGSLIVDDLQDGSRVRRGGPALHELYPPEVALNTGNWLYFWPLTLLSEAAIGLGDNDALRLHRRAAAALARCHQGQALDLTVDVTCLAIDQIAAVVAATSRLKTGSLMALAAAAGAIAAGASEATVAHLERVGEKLGTTLQMLDDLGSITSPRRRDKGLEDVRAKRATWPWAWLAASDDPTALIALRAQAEKSAEPMAWLAVLETLAGAVSEHGRHCMNAHFDEVLSLLSGAPAAATADLAAEIARLRESYE